MILGGNVGAESKLTRKPVLANHHRKALDVQCRTSFEEGDSLAERKPLSPPKLQMFWAGAYVLVLVYVWIAETFGKAFSGSITPWHWAVALLGIWSVWGGHSVRRKLIANATAESSGGKQLVASRKWSAAQLVALISAHGVVLWGVVAKMVLGCPRWFAGLFYITGIVLLTVWRPGKQAVVVEKEGEEE